MLPRPRRLWNGVFTLAIESVEPGVRYSRVSYLLPAALLAIAFIGAGHNSGRSHLANHRGEFSGESTTDPWSTGAGGRFCRASEKTIH
jgi:hypothetical protein